MRQERRASSAKLTRKICTYSRRRQSSCAVQGVSTKTRHFPSTVEQECSVFKFLLLNDTCPLDRERKHCFQIRRPYICHRRGKLVHLLTALALMRHKNSPSATCLLAGQTATAVLLLPESIAAIKSKVCATKFWCAAGSVNDIVVSSTGARGNRRAPARKLSRFAIASARSSDIRCHARIASDE